MKKCDIKAGHITYRHEAPASVAELRKTFGVRAVSTARNAGLGLDLVVNTTPPDPRHKRAYRPPRLSAIARYLPVGPTADSVR